MSIKLLLVGCGKMGGAMLSGWLEHRYTPPQIAVIEQADRLDEISQYYGVTAKAALSDFPEISPDIVVFAVKPRMLGDVIDAYGELGMQNTLFVSVVAGRTIGFFKDRLGPGSRIVRVMPNTPAAIGHGMSVLCTTGSLPDHQHRQAEALMSAVGETAWISDEAQMDAVTALSGSGPAYVFHLVEAMAKAGSDAGLPQELATRLARQTVIGAGALLADAPETAAGLRKNVTSPGGTTAAGLTILMDSNKGLPPLMRETIAAAKKRSAELG